MPFEGQIKTTNLKSAFLSNNYCFVYGTLLNYFAHHLLGWYLSTRLILAVNSAFLQFALP